MPKNRNSYSRPESHLRDFLADNLHLIERGMRLVQKEFPLPNPRGAKGFIDILARDVFGHRVVIEIKRSNASARQALHEFHKYVALLQMNQGFSDGELRCILISTDWHELATPFALFQRRATYAVEGFLAVLKEGNVTRLERIDAIAPAMPIQPFRHHGAYLFIDRKPYNSTARLERAMAKAGVSSAAIVLMRSKPDRTNVMYRYCQYFMVCDVTDTARVKYTTKIQRDAVLENPDDEEKQRLFEEEVLCNITASVGFHARRRTFEAAWPEKFAAEKDFWIIDRIIRTGRLRDDTLVTDDDLLNHLLGNTGTGVVSYNGVASPSFPSSWQAAKQQILRCLVGNTNWEHIAQHAFQAIESTPGRSTAVFHLYNPCDSLMMLFKLASRGDIRFIPSMEIAWVTEGSDDRHLVSGVIAWDGKTQPVTPAKLVRRAFGGDVIAYFLSRNFGDRECDAKFMKYHGLSYQAAHFSGNGRKDSGRWLVPQNGKVVERGFKVVKAKPLSRFIERNTDYLKELITWFDKNTFGA